MKLKSSDPSFTVKDSTKRLLPRGLAKKFKTHSCCKAGSILTCALKFPLFGVKEKCAVTLYSPTGLAVGLALGEALAEALGLAEAEALAEGLAEALAGGVAEAEGLGEVLAEGLAEGLVEGLAEGLEEGEGCATAE